MIQRLLCWLLGHKTVFKAPTGKQYVIMNQLTGQPDIGNYMRWARSEFCLRCGKRVHKDGDNGKRDVLG